MMAVDKYPRWLPTVCASLQAIVGPSIFVMLHDSTRFKPSLDECMGTLLDVFLGHTPGSSGLVGPPPRSGVTKRAAWLANHLDALPPPAPVPHFFKRPYNNQWRRTKKVKGKAKLIIFVVPPPD